MTDLTVLAKGRACEIRVPDVCNFNPETTVWAHLRLIGISGMGLKAPDFFGAFACFDCHDAVDRRRFMHLDRDYVRLRHLEGVARTQAILIDEGRIHW